MSPLWREGSPRCMSDEKGSLGMPTMIGTIYIYIYIHTYIHTSELYTHTHTHTHTHTLTHSLSHRLLEPPFSCHSLGIYMFGTIHILTYIHIRTIQTHTYRHTNSLSLSLILSLALCPPHPRKEHLRGTAGVFVQQNNARTEKNVFFVIKNSQKTTTK